MIEYSMFFDDIIPFSYWIEYKMCVALNAKVRINMSWYSEWFDSGIW